MKSKVFSDELVVIKLENNLFDVFSGNIGWDHWSRFQLDNHKVQLVAGESVDPKVYTRVRKIITKEFAE